MTALTRQVTNSDVTRAVDDGVLLWIDLMTKTHVYISNGVRITLSPRVTNHT